MAADGARKAIDRRATTLLLQQLVDTGVLELEGDPEDALATLGEAATAWIAEHVDDEHCGPRFAVFLERHPSVAEVYAEDELLAEKLAAWQQAVRRFAEPVTHRDPLLEDQILENPEDEALRLVYADLLQQHGDPLGELIARAASGNTRATKRLISEYGTFLFGPVEEYLRLFKPAYHLGFIRAITIARKQHLELEWPIVTGWLLDRPIARFLEQIQIGPIASHARHVELAVWNVVLGSPRPALRSLAIASKETRFVEPLALSLVAHGAPRLQALHVEVGRVTAEPFEHRTLRRFAVTLDNANELAAALADSALPELEELAITALRASEHVLWPRTAPALRVLRLSVGRDPAGVLAALLANAPLLAGLVELEIAYAGAEVGTLLVANADRFAHLAKLALPDRQVSDRVLRALAGKIA